MSESTALASKAQLTEYQRELLAEAEELSGLGSWENNLETKTITGTAKLFEIFELPDDHTLNQEDLRSYILEEDLKKIDHLIGQLMTRSTNRIFYSYRIRTPKGKIKYLEGHVRSYTNEQGVVTRFRGYVCDVTHEKKNESILRNVLDSSLDGIVVLEKIKNQEGRITDFSYQLVNKRGCQIIGKSENEIINSTLFTLFPSIYKNGVFDTYVTVAETGIAQTIHTHYTYDGLNCWFKIVVAPLNEGIMLTFSDITTHINNENEIRHKKDLLVSVQGLAKIGSFEWDLKTGEVAGSDALYTIFGLMPGQHSLTKELFLKYVHPADKVLLKQHMARCMLFPHTSSFECRIITTNGTQKYVKGQIKSLGNAETPISKLIGFCQDITEIKEAEQGILTAYTQLQQAQEILQQTNLQLEEKIQERTFALEEKNAALEQLVEEFKFVTDFMPQIVWAANPDGSNDFLNKGWYDYTGLSPDSIYKNLSGIVHPEDIEISRQAWETSLKTNAAFQIEYRLKRHDQEYRWFLVRAYPLKSSEGKIIKWYGTSTDIHDYKLVVNHLSQVREEMKFVNQELRIKNEVLQRVNNDLDNFIYTASHDLRAPINNIEGLVAALSETCTFDEDASKMMQMISLSVDRFKHTLADLTEIVKANAHELELESITIKDLITEIESDIKPLIEKEKASIFTHLEITEIHFSKKNLRSILYNLLSNAVKYRSPNRLPEVHISTKTENEWLVLTVQDNGLGLQQEDTDKVFQMFKRMHTHVEGTGIGMYIVKKIIENGGGHIMMQSELGKGSTFHVYLKNENWNA